MIQFTRRKFLNSMMAAVPVALAGSKQLLGATADFPFSRNGFTVANQIENEKTWAFFRSFYDATNVGDSNRVLANFLQSDETVFQDATLGLEFPGFSTVSAAFTQLFGAFLQTPGVGPGNIVSVFNVAGDLRYGAITEIVNFRNTFFSTNGFTEQRVFDLDGGLIVRSTDYSDSRELGESDIVGPANTKGVAFPFAPIHAGGTPRSSSTVVPPANIGLTTGATGKPSASPEMIEFAQEFHSALRYGNVNSILSFFTEDAVYVNPLIHQGPALYGNADQTIQIQGKELIERLFATAIESLPDCLGSSLIHIVGGQSGGGFEWKAGGRYSKTGINRTGLNGSTAVNLFNGKIRRMSVKFDTFQLPVTSYDLIRSKLAAVGVVDQDPL